MLDSFGNLLRPFILARLSLSAVATLACAIGLGVALSWLRAERTPLGDRARIRAERTAELASALVQTALVACVLATFVTIVGAERTHHEISGAMCAYGVLASTEHGFATIASGVLASAACAAWLALHRLDLRLPTPVLTRTKLLALGAVLPAVAYDFVTATRFALELDFSVVATCCSSALDSATPVLGAGPARAESFPFAVAAGVVAFAASIALVRRASRARALATAGSLAAFAAFGVLAATDVVAPHVFGVPSHRCAFCLLAAGGHGLGYPLLGALFVLVCLAAALAALESERRSAGDEVNQIERTIGRFTTASSAIALVALLVPVVAYRLTTGAFVVSPW